MCLSNSARACPYDSRSSPAPDQGRCPAGARGAVHGVDQGTRPIRDEHVAEAGLVVVDVAAADDDTVFAFQKTLAERRATATADRTTRTPGEPGVRLLHAAARTASRSGPHPRDQVECFVGDPVGEVGAPVADARGQPGGGILLGFGPVLVARLGRHIAGADRGGRYWRCQG
ncbi:DUF6207 family protein [Streptomyces sp. NPDC048304]|uniref:DUF6207 family protein n=1 Tax=Streptomyces sp. NPDC048304 TaxID=3154820 RepID=UPI0033C95789